MKTTLKLFICALCILFGLLGCFDFTNYVKSAPPALDANAKTFVVRSGESNIYAISDWASSFRNAVLLDVSENYFRKHYEPRSKEEYRFWEEQQLWLGHKQYRLLRVAPGNHQLTEYVSRHTISLTTEDGRNYFVRLVGKMGFWDAPTYSWEIIGEDEGKRLILERALADRWHHSPQP
jgi:hypothetical protein